MANQRNSSYNRKNSQNRTTSRAMYVDGNAAPAYAPQPRRRRKPVNPQPRPRTPEEEAQLRRRRSIARRNQQRELMMNRSYVVFLALATAVCAIACGIYISKRAGITSNIGQIAASQAELTELRASNDALAKEIEAFGENITSAKVAAAKLGLSYPTDNQIRYYSVDSSDYMNGVE